MRLASGDSGNTGKIDNQQNVLVLNPAFYAETVHDSQLSLSMLVIR
jgi:hypothetical protein